MTQETAVDNIVELEDASMHEFLPFWQVDEAQIEATKVFSEFASATNLKIKSRISEYKVIDESGKEEIVKADSAQLAASMAVLKNPKAIFYLENLQTSFLDKDQLEV